MVPRKRILKASLLLLSVAALGGVILASGCARVSTTAGQPARQPTAIEQVLTWNAEIADANLAIAKGVIAASDANQIDVPTANKILTQQSRIADVDRQLTPILAKACGNKTKCQPGLLSGDAAQIRALLAQIKTSAAVLVSDGTAGIKNKDHAATVQRSIETISTVVDEMLGALNTLGVL